MSLGSTIFMDLVGKVTGDRLGAPFFFLGPYCRIVVEIYGIDMDIYGIYGIYISLYVHNR